MRILVVGDWHSDLHEEVVFHSFVKLGHEVTAFSWHRYFMQTAGLRARIDSLFKRAQNKYLAGPHLWKLNRDLINQASRESPDMIFIYRGTHILPNTLRRLRVVAPNVTLVGYNNDDPFSPDQPRWLWRHFLRGVPEYDLVLAYRQHNIDEFRRAGARQVELLRSWFIPERNHPVNLSEADRARYACDVVFVGHYESDQRKACLEAVVRRGWRLNLFGHGYGWNPAIRDSPELSGKAQVRTVWGEEYNKALAGARIALCFLSKLNRDTYTRRCFEIPATGTMLLSEYTEDLAALYREGEDADFFRNQEEMVEKIERYLSNESLRKVVADSGFRRVMADGHDVVSRMKKVLEWVSEIRGVAL